MPRHVVDERRRALERLLTTRRYLPLAEICRRLQISEATARRDLAALAHAGRLTRTRGGALADFNERFQSFSERRGRAAASKATLGRAALGVLGAGRTVFLDSGTTLAALAEALAEAPPGLLRVVTVNLPAAELLASASENFEVHLPGGQMLARQSALLGEGAVRGLERWRFDVAFLSCEGMDAEGLWNSRLEIVAHQHAVVRRAARHVFLLDRTKVGRRAAHFLLPWAAVDCLLCDAAAARVAAVAPEAAVRHWAPGQPPPFRLEEGGRDEDIPVHYL